MSIRKNLVFIIFHQLPFSSAACQCQKLTSIKPISKRAPQHQHQQQQQQKGNLPWFLALSEQIMFSPPLQCGWSRRRAQRREYWPKPMGRGPFEHKTTSFLPPKPISDEGQRFNQANKETYHFGSFSYSSCPLQIHVCDIRLQEGSASVCWFPFSNLKQTPERCPLGRGIPIASSFSATESLQPLTITHLTTWKVWEEILKIAG